MDIHPLGLGQLLPCIAGNNFSNDVDAKNVHLNNQSRLLSNTIHYTRPIQYFLTMIIIYTQTIKLCSLDVYVCRFNMDARISFKLLSLQTLII